MIIRDKVRAIVWLQVMIGLTSQKINTIDDKVDIPANTVLDILIQTPQPLSEPSPLDLQKNYMFEDITQ